MTVSIQWWSDWRTATGTGTTAIYDGGKWGGGSWPYDIEVVSATGLGFPAGMTNVFQSNVDLTGGDVTVWEEWPQIAIGEALAFRIYMRHDMTNAGSDNIAAYNYMICPGGGSPFSAWQYRFGIRANDDIFDFGMEGYDDAIDMDELAVEYGSGTVFCIEWSFERVTTSTYRCRTKVTDPDDYETVYGTADTVTADFTDLEVAVSSSPAGKDVAPTRLLQLGWFGVGGGNWTNLTGSFYFGGVAVAITDPGEWIGAYPVTEENGAAPARRVIVVT